MPDGSWPCSKPKTDAKTLSKPPSTILPLIHLMNRGLASHLLFHDWFFPKLLTVHVVAFSSIKMHHVRAHDLSSNDQQSRSANSKPVFAKARSSGQTEPFFFAIVFVVAIVFVEISNIERTQKRISFEIVHVVRIHDVCYN